MKKKQITKEYIRQDATYIKFENLQYIQWYMKVEEVWPTPVQAMKMYIICKEI